MKSLAIVSMTLLLGFCSVDITDAPLVTPAPTATPCTCPTAIVCPTLDYRPLPDAEQQLIDLELALTSITQANKALDVILALPGDYFSPPHAQAVAARNHLANAYEWVDSARNALWGWDQSGLLTCGGGEQ